MSRCTGWLLNFSGGAQAVIGQRELLHLIDEPQTHEVPCSPAYSRRVIFWGEGVLPVFDVGAWSDQATESVQDQVVAIVGYRSDSDTSPGFGGLFLKSAPQRIGVDDACACDLPPALTRWRSVSCACFESGGRPLPVLDLNRLFNGRLTCDRWRSGP
jgi:chemotaxis signal transduction protein